jgi:hypothetical protein
MIRSAALVLGLALALSVVSGSATPAPGHPGKAVAHSAPAAQPAPSPPGSSKANPVYVAAQCEHGCGYAEDRRSFLDRIWTDPIAAFTAVLGVSTIALWWVTRSMADTSKRTLLDLERPIVYGGVSEPGLKIDSAGLEPRLLELSIYNHGRTMARLRRIEWRVDLAPHGSIADSIDPAKVGGRELPAGTVCVSGDPHLESENLFAKFSFEDRASIVAGKLSVWVVGFVRYDDVPGRHHISGFAQVFDPVGQRFVRRGGERYNYERVEPSRKIPPPSSTG